MKKYFKYLVFSVLALTFSSCSEFQKIQKGDNMEAKYEAAVKYYDKKDYYRSGLLLEELVPIMRGSSNAEKSLFMYAYTHYYQKQLYLSAYYFSNLFSTYPRSEYVEEARYMYNLSNYENTPKYNLDQSETLKTIQSLQGYINKYPLTQYRGDCERMILDLEERLERKAYESSKLYNKIGYYQAAVVDINNFLKTYPNSKYADELMYLKIESQFTLAKRSVIEKQMERYKESIKFYQEYVDRFPNGKFVKKAEILYDQAVSYVRKMNETLS